MYIGSPSPGSSPNLLWQPCFCAVRARDKEANATPGGIRWQKPERLCARCHLHTGELAEAAADLHLVAKGQAQQGDIKVEVGGLLMATVVHGAGSRLPEYHLHQVCTGKGRCLDKGRLCW